MAPSRRLPARMTGPSSSSQQQPMLNVPPPASQIWKVPELRSSILGHIAGLCEGYSWKRGVTQYLTLNKETFADVAGIIYEKVREFDGNNIHMSAWDRSISGRPALVDYLEWKGCTFARIRLYSSYVRIFVMDLVRPILRLPPVIHFRQAKLLNLYPNLQAIQYRFVRTSTSVWDPPYRSAVLRRDNTGDDEGLAKLALLVQGNRPPGYDVNVITKDFVNRGSADNKIHLESLVFEDIVITTAENGYTWFYKGLNGAKAIHLTKLHLGESSVSSSELREILEATPNLADLAVNMTDPETDAAVLDTPHLDTFFDLVPHLHTLTLATDDPQWVKPFPTVLDHLLRRCPRLTTLSLPVRFDKSDGGRSDWLFVDDDPVEYPRELPAAPRWGLDLLTLKIHESSRKNLSQLSLMFFLSTAISLNCSLVFEESDLDLPGFEDQDGNTGAGAWEEAVDSGRRRIGEGLLYGGVRERRKAGWEVLPREA